VTKWNGVGEKQLIGLEHFRSLFASTDYWRTFSNTLKLVGITLIVQVPGGLLIAYLLHHKTRFFKLYRTLYFLPVVIAPVAIGLMFSLFYNSEVGIFNQLLDAVGLGACKRRWLSDPQVVVYSVIAPQAWQYIGMYITIFLAALQGVPEELMESAQIEGANSAQRFWHIMLPQIRSFVVICLILCITGAFKSFEHPWVMTSGGPGVWSSYLGVYMYRTAFVDFDFGKASAISVTIVALSLCSTAVIKGISARVEKEG
jgi:raffinose/stachyose/melibiose transport system permease protein